MRKTLWFMVIIIAAISGLHAMKLMEVSTITGRILPASGVSQVWAVNQNDSKKATFKDSIFILQVQGGRYSIVIEAKPPYKNVVKENIIVEKGMNTDIGEVKLEQQGK